ncbi:MAG: hypothetical protein IPL46_08250 [Saprospiraceae bacterium]|nr:hypothetical protein [Saprospiraceae bacterium]
MYSLKSREKQPGIELLTIEGKQVPLHVTFSNGEIHINSNCMDKGSYQLVVNRGKIKESREFVVF